MTKDFFYGLTTVGSIIYTSKPPPQLTYHLCRRSDWSHYEIKAQFSDKLQISEAEIS